MTIAMLLLALIIILIGAELFTNALEHVGDRLKISEGVTGSIFAAVGTALPETMVPLVAIFSSDVQKTTRDEVSVGAILGAPIMLATVAFFLMAVFAARKRGWRGEFQPERTGLNRDLRWFLVAFSLGIVAMFIPHTESWARGTVGIALVLIYVLYLVVTLRASKKLVAEGHGTEADKPLYLTKLFGFVGLRENWVTILLQLAIGLGLIIYGAHFFVHEIENLSLRTGVTILVLTLLIVPVATELPEKINSILWIRRRKDTLAFGNITGAMVFQGTLLPAIGVMLTPWEPHPVVLGGALLALFAAVYISILLARGVLRPVHLVLNGVCYLVFFALVLLW